MGYRSSVIKSIQRGTITIGTSETSHTDTVSPVVTDNCILNLLGPGTTTLQLTERSILAFLALTNTTTVTAARFTNTDSGTVTVSYELVEYVPGVIKSRQEISIVMGVSNSNAAIITAVNTLKTQLIYLGLSTNDAAGNFEGWSSKLVLTNATTVTIDRNTFSNTVTGYLQVIEWK